jgi:hypothetical protein
MEEDLVGEVRWQRAWAWLGQVLGAGRQQVEAEGEGDGDGEGEGELVVVSEVESTDVRTE